MSDLQQLKDELMQNPEFRKEYESDRKGIIECTYKSRIISNGACRKNRNKSGRHKQIRKWNKKS